MENRAGPPSPRNNGPWINPGDQREQYAARDAACDEWVARIYGDTIIPPREIMLAKTAFCAGWSAHKQAVLEMAFGLDKRVRPMATLFPTDAELEGRN